MKAYLAKATGLSRAQLTRLTAQHRRTGDIRDRRGKPPANAFRRRYTPRDAALLAEVDDAYGRLSGPATKEIFRRQYEVHGDGRFERLARISNGHIYNLRKARDYRLGALLLAKTRPVHIPSASAASPTSTDVPASSVSTPSTRATSTARRGSTSSTSSIRSPSSSTSAPPSAPASTSTPRRASIT